MGKIRVTFMLQQSDIGHLIRRPLELSLDEGGSVIDAIRLIDEEILKKISGFPVKGYKSLLHMVYHPFENRFYKQVAIQGYTSPGVFLNVRKNPKEPLPNDVTIVLAPEGPCILEREDVVDW